MVPTRRTVDDDLSSRFLSGQLGPERHRLRCALSRVGTTVAGKYKLGRLLGAGGMGDVYAAVHVRNQLGVAVKVIHGELASDDVLCRHFLREGYLANAVSHPGTIHVLDDDVTEDGCPFLVMELLEGETLEKRWRRCGGRLDLDEVVWITGALLDVLAAAHAHGIIHRDIKPDNVFLSKSGALRLLDFGIALEESGWCSGTPPGTILGTLGFMPPEQALGHTSEVDCRSDLWSVGALAFALLTGRLVHPPGPTGEMLMSAATTRVASIAAVAPEVPGGIASVIDRALAFERGDRWTSAQAMRQALLRFDAEASESSLSIPIDLVPPIRRPARRVAVESARGEAEHAKLALASTDLAPVRAEVPSSTELRAWKRDLRDWRGLALAGAALVGLAAVAAGSRWGRPTVVLVENGPAFAAEPTLALDCSATPEAARLADLRDPGERYAQVASAPPTPRGPPPRRDLAIDVGRPDSAALLPRILPDASPVAAAGALFPSTDCVPPYVVDERGRVHFKSECL